MLRTLISGLALTHTPEQVQFYCLDFGGGTLAGLADLPHVGSVATRLDPDRLRRTVAEVNALLAAREELFTRHRIDSMATYRRAAPPARVPRDGFGDVFLVVDGWGTSAPTTRLWRPRSPRSPRAGSATACTSCCPSSAGWSCARRCAT